MRGAVPKWLREQSAKLRCSGSTPLGASTAHFLLGLSGSSGFTSTKYTRQTRQTEQTNEQDRLADIFSIPLGVSSKAGSPMAGKEYKVKQ